MEQAQKIDYDRSCQLLEISTELVELLPSGFLRELHKMRKEYLEKELGFDHRSIMDICSQ